MSKKLAENQLSLGTKYESLIESANRLALGIEDDHNLISGFGEKNILYDAKNSNYTKIQKFDKIIYIFSPFF